MKMNRHFTILCISFVIIGLITLWQWENTLILEIGSILFLGLLIWLIIIVAKTEKHKL